MRLALSKIKPNPENPRLIKDDKFKKLVQSLKDFPVMTELREVVLDEDGVIIGGNMRYKAAQQAGWKEIDVKYFTKEDAERNNKLTRQNLSYEEYRQQFIVKDNVSGGEWDWDVLANQYELEDLEAWDVELPFNDEKVNDNKEVDPESLLSEGTVECPRCKFQFEV